MKTVTQQIFFFFPLIFFFSKGFSQTPPKPLQVSVYFVSGAYRNITATDTSASITSTNIINVLNNYGISTTHVYPSFPTFNESDTNYVTELGDTLKEMNKAKIFAVTYFDSTITPSLINALKNLNEVLFAEYNGSSTSSTTPNDTYFSPSQHGLYNTTIPGADIHALTAWDIFTGNPNSIIAIIDEGVDNRTDDINTKLVSGSDNTCYIGRDGTGNITSHGTLVAGVAAAETNNSKGIAGVDWKAKILAKDKHDYGNSSSIGYYFETHGDALISKKIIEAVKYSPNVWTLNHSYELLNNDDSHGRFSIVVREAFAYAYKNNRVSCVAMGNSSVPSSTDYITYPAAYQTGLIAVGATEPDDTKRATSITGSYIDVAAPGSDIISTNYGTNNYFFAGGTSMASPFVAGLASLLKGYNTNLYNDDVENIIKLSADDKGAVGFDNDFGFGRINAEKALKFLQAPYDLQHLTTTGGTAYATTSNIKVAMLGVPRLSDGFYYGDRIEVRKTVNLPTNYCSLVGVWGDGTNSTGYKNEGDYCYGEGLSEIVPGTQTASSITLRSYVYLLYDITGRAIGYYPKSPEYVTFSYTVLGNTPLPNAITGVNPICSSEVYSLNISAPSGASVAWSAAPRRIVGLTTTGNQVTAVKNNDGVFTLTATITGACGNANPFTITRNLTAGPFLPYIAGPYDPVQHTIMNGGYVGQQYYFVATESTPEYPTPTYTWTLTPPAASGGLPSMYSGGTIYLYFNDGEGDYTLDLAKTTACGINHTIMIIHVQQNYGFRMAVSPNPTTGDVQIEALGTDQTTIKEIQVTDKLGNVKKKIKLTTDTKKHKINIAELPADVYFIRIYDGKTWVSKKIIKN